MPLFRHTAACVLAEADARTLVEHLATQFVRAYGYRPSPGERRAWEKSLPILARDLCGAGLGEVEMLIEYQLATTTYRADVILCGVHPGSARPSYVVVELKQWTDVKPVEDAPDLCSVPDYMEYALHPAEQVRRYCEWMSDYVRAIDATFAELGGVAYLHNANDASMKWLHDLTANENTRLFTGANRGEFVQYLRSRLGEGPGAKAADTLLASKIAPGKQLMALAAAEIARREQFVLLDEQQVAYSLVMRTAERARTADTKEVVIVTGGPGSGKSVIAMSLLGELNRRGIHAYHASGSRSFTMTLRKIAGYRNGRVKSLFKYFNNLRSAALTCVYESL